MTSVSSPLPTMTSVPSHTLLTTSAEDDTTFDYDYSDPPAFNMSLEKPSPLCINEAGCVILVVINVIIFLLGTLGNGLVIWVVAYKMKKKTVNTTWYLSLALSDFIYCATLPFNITLTATGSWKFGRLMCKFTSFVLFLNMFSSIFLMVIISIDRCVTVVCAVWAQNNRTQRKAAVAVVVAWLFSMLLSIPSLVVRDILTDNHQVTKCYNNFELLPNTNTGIPVFRFVLGFVFPLIIITVCSTVIIVRLQNKFATKSTKAFKVMTALVVTFVICWLPYHIFILLESNPSQSHHTLISTGTMISVTLASANSCMNPFLYAFMGKDVKQKLISSFASKIESAFSEDGPSGSRATSRRSISVSQL